MLFRGWPQPAVEWRDVDERPEWREAYGDRGAGAVAGDGNRLRLQPDLGRIASVSEKMSNRYNPPALCGGSRPKRNFPWKVPFFIRLR